MSNEDTTSIEINGVTEDATDASLVMFEAIGPIIEGQPVGTVVLTMALVLGGLLSSESLTKEQKQAGANIILTLGAKVGFDAGMSPEEIIQQIANSYTKPAGEAQ